MNKSLRVFRLVIGLLVMVGGGWEGLNSETRAQGFSMLNVHDSSAEEKLIQRILTRQTEAWNQGDLEQFMKTYWKSPLLTFSAGGKTTRGWEATLKRYQESYAPPQEMGKLRFDQMEITLLESKTAMVLGNWQLEMSNEKHRSGNFSLVLHKIDDQWRIIHDHSSSLEPPKNEAHEESPPAAPAASPAIDSDTKDGLQKVSNPFRDFFHRLVTVHGLDPNTSTNRKQPCKGGYTCLRRVLLLPFSHDLTSRISSRERLQNNEIDQRA